jgi:hypothetical protein
LTATGNKYLRPLLDKVLCRTKADAGAAAGDNCDLAFELPCHRSIPSDLRRLFARRCVVLRDPLDHATEGTDWTESAVESGGD